jgi:NitT/TauT family transport system permease protein
MNTSVQAADPEPDVVSPDSSAPAKAPVITGAHSSAALKVGDLAPRRRRPIINLFLPNRAISASAMWVVAAIEAALFLTLWVFSPYKVLPRPDEVLAALFNLWLNQGLGQELAVSFGLNLSALLWSSLISLSLAYLTVIPIFRPIVTAISKGRFLSLAGFTFVFTLVVGGGRPLKLSLLVFAITFFYVTSMAAVIAAIPRSEFEHARTLRMSEWRVVWEVVILGTADKAFEVLRQNAAMGWMMLTLVEGIVRAEGGVGTLLLAESKHFQLADVFAIQLLILIVGLVQDYGISFLRRLACPYADLTLERQ